MIYDDLLKYNYCPSEKDAHSHTHEYLGSTKIAEKREDPHNHRFAGVTGDAIPVPGSHIHKLKTNTDNFEDHFHAICDETGPAIPTCEGRHIHFVKGKTTFDDGHKHEYIFATLIENPIADDNKHRY